MKSFRSHLIPLAVCMAAAEAAASTGAAPAANAEVPTSNAAGAAEATKKRAPKNPDNKLDIINGRLPMPLVYLIRFKETGTTNERAKKYGTSVGKVFDIVKGHNFGYIKEDYKPSADEVAAANAWCDSGKSFKGHSLKELGGDPDAIKAAVAALGVATAEEVAKRGWTTRVVGERKAPAGTAPVAASAPATAAAGASDSGAAQGAKLF